jgi:P-type Mg2+ transporter
MAQLKVLRQTPQRVKRRSTVSPLLWEVAQGDPAVALKTMEASLEGLTDAEVDRRRRTYGKNEVSHEKPPPWWLQFLKAFSSPFILVLLILAIVSYVTDVYLARDPQAVDWKKVIILAAMILVSGILRFWQEFRSIWAADRLKAMVRTTATVSRVRTNHLQTPMRGSLSGRDGQQEVLIAELVPGDIIHLSAGDMVAADVRLIAAKDLFVSQSVLTGESMPVEKHDVLRLGDKDPRNTSFSRQANPLEMDDLSLMGTNVVSGTATAIVVATGDRTFFGSLAGRVIGRRATTSFDQGVNKVTFVLIKFMLIMVPVVMVITGITKGDWKEAFLFGLAVAVGLTPEMLPLVVAANLARGAIKLSKHRVIVKQMNSIQTFGAMDVLCTDKTGTLTEDRVVLVQHIDSSGKNNSDVLKYAYLNSLFQTGLKNLLDRAIIERAEEKSLKKVADCYIKLDEIPFDFLRRRMSVILCRNDLRRILVCKGAVEEVFETCAQIGDENSKRPFTEPERKHLKALRDELNAEGMRVVAVAWKSVEVTERDFSTRDEKDLIFAGFVAFLDPPKASAGGAIKALNEHGVKVKIITGDNPIIAAKVCREVGLDPGEIILGHELEDMNDDELGCFAEETNVFAKMNPLQKARVVRVLRAKGHTVGYLGDGINDAIALRDADVGISVDTAVDIAKESADIILLEKSLMVLEDGVTQGRVVFGNIVKYIKMTTSSNFGNALSVIIASAFIPFLPMAALQLMVQNLLYDLSQISLPWDNVDKEFVQRPRKWDAPGIARFMILIGPISSIFDITTFCLLWFIFGANSAAHQLLFQSGWFIEGLLSQTLIVHMIRTQRIPFIQSIAAVPVLLLTGAIMVIGVAIPFTHFGASIGLQPLPKTFFPWLAATLLSYCIVTQFVKLWYLRRFKTWL